MGLENHLRHQGPFKLLRDIYPEGEGTGKAYALYLNIAAYELELAAERHELLR